VDAATSFVRGSNFLLSRLRTRDYEGSCHRRLIEVQRGVNLKERLGEGVTSQFHQNLSGRVVAIFEMIKRKSGDFFDFVFHLFLELPLSHHKTISIFMISP
jgi:hypothetical protein